MTDEILVGVTASASATPAESAPQRPGGSPRRSLSALDGVVLLVGLVIGVGIFRAPQIVAANSSTHLEFLALWILGGAVSLVGALCYAELGAAYPHAGGEYHFLSRALGSTVGFLFGWSRMTVIQTGSIGILAYVFGDYAASLLALGEGASPLLAAAAIVALTLMNAAGLRLARRTQYLFTTLEVLGLLALILAGFFWVDPSGANARPDTAGTPASPPQLGLAMVFVLLTFGGWSEAAYISAEFRDGRKGVSRALLWGVGTITLLYILANAAYLTGLGLGGISRSTVVAADLMRQATPAGAVVVSLLVVVSALSSANATIITGARSNYAVGRDFEALARLGSWRDRTSAPVPALLLQGAIALVLVVFGAVTRSGFESMVAYTAPVFWLILLLTGISLPLLRKRDPLRERPFRVPLYPVTPVAFCAAAAFMLYSSLAYAGAGAVLGVLVMLAGLPVLVVLRARAEGASVRRDAFERSP
jgi:amino acid transporter